MISLGGGMTVCLHILQQRLSRKNVDLRITTRTADQLLQSLRTRSICC